MLTDLSFLNLGEQFPPLSEADRLNLYAKNHALFEGEHGTVYFEAFKRIERVISNFQEVVSYATVINYQKLLSLKTADLLLGEMPKIVAGEFDSPEQKSVDAIAENSDLHNTAYEAAIDLSRYGDGLFLIYQDGNKGMIDVTQPPIWFPVVDPTNIKRIKQHVLAWTYMDGEAKHLLVRVHDKGFYTETTFLLEGSADGWRIKDVLNPEQTFQTGLDDFAVVPVHNVMTSDRIHGLDDYTDVDSIISELLVRVGQVAKILDKHADPSVTGPMSALERDPVTDEWKLKMGNYFPRDGKEDAEVKYITWDGQLEASFKMIELLINFLHAISEMGSELLGDRSGTSGAGALSGTALRFKMVSPLAKVKRISNRFRPALIKAIRLCSQLGGEGVKDLSDVPISITFLDGLPEDPREEAEVMALRTGQKATMSIQRALEVYDGMTPTDAEEELKRIDEDETKANPLKGMNTSFNGNNEPPGDNAE